MKAIAIIKKMPNDCDECPFVNENRYCILLNEDAFPNDWVEDAPYYSLKEKGDCPLRPLPKGHGRLIDADAFIRFIKDVSERQKYEEVLIDKNLTVEDVLDAVVGSLENKGLAEGDTPTIVSADKEAE